MNQDHASAPQAAETMLNTQATPARPIAYDQAIAFNVCDWFGNGESLEAILAGQGMPDEDAFFAGRGDLPYVAARTSRTRARSSGLHKLCEPKAKLTTKIGFWQNEPNLRDPIGELGQ